MQPTKPVKARPSDILWHPQSIIWVVLAAEGLAIVLALAPGASSGRWVYFGIASLVLQWVALLSLGMLYLGRKSLDTLTPQRIAWWAVLAMLLASHALGAVLWLAIPELREVPTQSLLTQWLQFLGILLVVGLFSVIAFQNHWQSRQLALQLKQAELDKLRARVNPHFLFNTLNTATALVHEQPDQAERTLLDLSDLFRAALSGREITSIEQELDLTRRYLEIESLRLGDRLSVRWRLPETIPSLTIPTLTLQALAENAIHHGIEHRQEGGTISIEVETDSHGVVLRVTNPLAHEKSGTHAGHQVGLSASQARIDAMTAGQGKLQSREEAGNFIVEIILPPTSPLNSPTSD